jgi:GMP synthase (glutamine-hydrolysing)
VAAASPRLLVVQHEDVCTVGLLGRWLTDAGALLDVRRPYAGDPLPSSLADHDGLVVLGGSMGADDDAACPWLTPTKELVRDGARRGVPVLGTCLGHQLCAVALGGVVGVNPLGPQTGVTPIGWVLEAGTDPLCRPLTGQSIGVHWNNDVVLRLPADGVLLARAPRGEIQAARLAATVWGVQWHPEVDAALVAPWAEDDRDRYPDGFVDELVQGIADRHAELAGWRALAESFVARVRDV